MWDSLTTEDVEELLIVLHTIPSSSTSVIKLVEALQQHPSRIVPCPAQQTRQVDTSLSPEELGKKASSRKKKMCCRNGQKVVEIRKAPAIDDASAGEVYNMPVDEIDDTQSNTLQEDLEGSDSPGTGSEGSDYDEENSNGKRRKKKSRPRKNGGQKRRIRKSEDIETSPKKWRTDGETPTVPPQAETFMFSLASVKDQVREDDMYSFLRAIHPTSSNQFRDPTHDVDSAFAVLAARCQHRHRNSKIAEFDHMVSLVVLAIYVNRQVC